MSKNYERAMAGSDGFQGEEHYALFICPQCNLEEALREIEKGESPRCPNCGTYMHVTAKGFLAYKAPSPVDHG